jgi:quercetin dioxygenase-like cupin family protein
VTAHDRPNTDYIGHWPVDPEGARAAKRLIAISPTEHLHLIHGRDQHILVSLIVSNEHVTVGLLTIPPGGFSEIEGHDGEEALEVLQGTLVVRTFDSGEELDTEKASHMSLTVRCGEKLYLPRGMKHCYKNFGEDSVRAFFAVAPAL